MFSLEGLANSEEWSSRQGKMTIKRFNMCVIEVPYKEWDKSNIWKQNNLELFKTGEKHWSIDFRSHEKSQLR